MSEPIQNTPNPGVQPTIEQPNPAACGVSIARRRALLKGLGKGAALAGAAAPLSSLATGGKDMMRLTKTDGKNYICTVSGHVSAMHSAVAAMPPLCSGKHYSHYKKNSQNQRPTWPTNGKGQPVCKFGTIDRYPGDSFYTCFGGGSGNSIGALCDSGSSTDEAYWVAAVLNSNKVSSFPYTSTEVVNLYRGIGGTPSAALTFFKSYLSAV